MDPKNLSISDYDYLLPGSKIAAYPSAQRDESKLLIFDPARGISEGVFNQIPTHLPQGARIIFNNTRVIPARLVFYKPSGARIEIFCLEPPEGDISSALGSTGNVTWKCLVGNAASWPAGMALVKKTGDQGMVISAWKLSFQKDHFLVKLSWEPAHLSFAEVLHFSGQTPLPPYIKRTPEEVDTNRYQTVYADFPGSVAAPTAGLHFTEKTMEDLRKKNITIDFVTLQVGAGTFKPVKSETMKEHDMHSEWIEIDLASIEHFVDHPDQKIIAVGTTSLRTIESLYWIGKKLIEDPTLRPDSIKVGQWYPYAGEPHIPVAESLKAITIRMRSLGMTRLVTQTALLIAPGYRFKIADILITNFHQPRSTLLLLVAAFVGEKWKSVYTYALENGFRFLSYGDACLFFRQEPPL